MSNYPLTKESKGLGSMTKQRDDVEAIKQLALDWNAGWDNSDTEALLSLYADDPILMPQGRPAVVGKDAIRSLYQSFFEGFTIKGKGKVEEVEVSGDLEYFWSNYTLTATPKAGGEQIKDEGKSVFIVRRQDDNSWKIARLIDNSNREQAVTDN
jgi:uncharacterized protein (TIGR02246 family)